MSGLPDVDTAAARPWRLRDIRSVLSLGLIDQVLQSATTVLLLVAAGRALGPGGLGAIALGFSALLIPAAVQRALVIDPYLTRDSPEDDRSAYAAAVSVTLLWAFGSGLVFLVVGVVVDNDLGRGCLVFAAWLPAYLLQALFRPAAFRRGRGRLAVGASATLLMTMIAVLAVGRPDTLFSVTAAWGVSMTVTAALALVTSESPRVASLKESTTWFRTDAFPFGKWLAMSSGVYTTCSYLTMAVLASTLGAAALGGYRAVESIFAPLSVLGPGLGNPGYREMHLAQAGRRRLQVAAAISGLALGLTGAYVLALFLGQDLFGLLFGTEFMSYTNLVAPVAVGQLILAAPLGFALLLKVARQGRLFLPIGLLTPISTLLTVSIVAPRWGLLTTIWAISLCGLLSTAWAVFAAFRVAGRQRT